jgi:hypothetical protein
MKKNSYSRREFLEISTAAAGASLATQTMVPFPHGLGLAPRAVAASDRVRFGMVGVGMQGSGLLSQSIRLPGVECAGACDLYDGRHTLAREIVRPELPVTRRYQVLLDDKNIDCIVAAVPDHWHKQVVVTAVSAYMDDVAAAMDEPVDQRAHHDVTPTISLHTLTSFPRARRRVRRALPGP